MPHAIYQSYHIKDCQIRLVSLKRGMVYDPIECDLQVASLSSQENYEALSYPWGNLALTTPIRLSGMAFQVTASLELALRHLHDEDQDRILWIDAICIN